ncbi:hypothetical protein GSI_03380 [Ganoderma sinense ZZ0214-1]|uniref:Uncharacterized protein n=1 Tax=Ganoderma sinense ZZ0214-1 TaxID=1077348 RepID=A0A2G8SLG7_9APHY|nr:hypothetical protein GSI_03380 [Ganoderma sinense ZZ0214-1]
MPPSGSFISFAAAACKIALVLTTFGYAGVVAHRMRTQNAQLQKAVDEARAERERLIQQVALERSRAESVVEEKRQESEFWRRMEALARSELRNRDKAVEQEGGPARSSSREVTEDSRLSDGSPALRAQVADVRSTNSSYDDIVLAMVRTLNFEISEVASQVTNAFRVADEPDPEKVRQAFERAREAVGPVMAELLESIQHQDDPILIDIALKADMVGFAAEVASAWDFQHQSKPVFTGLYKQMRRSESQLVSGQWRSRARKYSKQRLYNGRDLVPGFSQQLAERIADLLTVAGGSFVAEDIHAQYTQHLDTIIRTALDLQRIIGEEVVECDYEVLTSHFDDVFDPEQMEDIYNGEIAATGPPGTVPRVLSTADLGLRRSEKVSGAHSDADDGLSVTMLLKPKVVLDTVVYELGLVDEEDASPSTVGPST